MCEPATLALAGTAVVGGYLSGKAKKESAEFSAQENKENARLAESAAKDAIHRGEREAQVAKLKAGQLEGQQVAGIGASGIDVTSGTAQQVVDQTRLMSEIDQATIRNNAAREAWGYRMQAKGFERQAGFDQRAGSNAQTASILGGFAEAAPRLVGAAADYRARRKKDKKPANYFDP